jgi:hypothetical protein
MGFNQSFAPSSVKSADLFSAVLAGFGIWTKPPQAVAQNLPTLAKSEQAAASNVYPLRVIRVRDTDHLNASASNMPKMAGRMVISGRMSDVCAELDRLAA